MKKRFALLTLCAAFAVSACGSSHKAKPPGTDVNFKPEFTSVGFSAFSDELAKKTNDLPALEQLSSDTATLAAIEDTAFADADNQDVPRFTADCLQLEAGGRSMECGFGEHQEELPDGARSRRLGSHGRRNHAGRTDGRMRPIYGFALARSGRLDRCHACGPGLAEGPEGSSPAAVGADYVNLHHLDRRDCEPRTGGQ